MAIWFNAKGKTYASTGPTAWLKRYVDQTIENLRTGFQLQIDNLPVQGLKNKTVSPLYGETVTAEEGATIIGDIQERVYDEKGKFEAGNVASGRHAIAMGSCTTAAGECSVAGGYGCSANDTCAIALGNLAGAEKSCAVALGNNVIANASEQMVHGRFNLPDEAMLHIVGNGTQETDRKNAYTLDQKGNGWFAGGVTVGVDKEPLTTEKRVTELMDKLVHKTNEEDLEISTEGKLTLNSGSNNDMEINCDGITIQSESGISLDGFSYCDIRTDTDMNIQAEYIMDIIAGDEILVRAKNRNINLDTPNGDVLINGINITQMISDMSNAIDSLTQRLAELESVNADLENIIEMQENLIGGDEA